MATTYIDIVNKVLRRLREPTVDTVNENDYSTLIGEFVNETKREVEDAWDWAALRTTLTLDTISSTFNYVLSNSTTRIRILDVYDDTNDCAVTAQSTHWFDAAYQTTTVSSGKPQYYNLNGVDSNGDSQMDLYPIPDGVYNVRINCVIPDPVLVEDADTTTLPSEIIVLGAVSRAMEERGVDGGNQNAEMRYRMSMSDHIAIEANTRSDEIRWGAV